MAGESKTALLSESPALLGFVGAVVATRYRLLRLVGWGGQGEVWLAADSSMDKTVAVKLIRCTSPGDAARACREIAALRMLRIRGVVRLLDEGIEAEHAFIAMDPVEGAPFPGSSGPCSWETIAGPTMGLLHTLSRVHALGLIHRDLKPGNVLVDASGVVTVLDFGLALFGAPAGDGERESGAGTPSYMAPEQIRNYEVSTRTDLFACGVMIYEALSGRRPHEADHARLLASDLVRRDRRFDAAPPIRETAPDTPPFVAEVLHALLAVEPRDRPRSASEVIEALDRPSRARTPRVMPDALRMLIAPRGVDRVEALEESELRAIFAGPDLLLHLREDAARVLAKRTGGAPDAVVREIESWTRSGLARWAGGLVNLDRDALERLDSDGWAREPPAIDAVMTDALSTARRRLDEGETAKAVLALEEGMRWLGYVIPPRVDGVERLLALWVEVALASATTPALDRARYEIRRVEPPTPLLARLGQLVEAALQSRQWSSRALSILDSIEPFEDAVLECCRQGLRVVATRRSGGDEEALLETIEGWVARCRDRRVDASYKGWWARLRYRQGRFEESARLHAEAADLEASVSGRCAALVSEASAWLEAFEHRSASVAAERALAVAEAFRHPLLELRARWVLRSVAYRAGCDLEVDHAFVDAAGSIGAPEWEPLVILTEAAIAWRADRTDLARTYAARAYDAWQPSGEKAGRGLAGGLVVATGGALTETDVAVLVEQAVACWAPGVGLQVLALLSAGHAVAKVPAETVVRLAEQVPATHWHTRLDILSIREALAMLGTPE